MIDYIRNRFWNLYADLKQYKENPNQDDKKKLLLVLDRPEVPLHNNSSENEIRDEVKKRKISAGTRSKNGRLSRNTFLGLKKTCKKLGVSFYEYLLARLSHDKKIPYLPDLISLKLSGETWLPPTLEEVTDKTLLFLYFS